MRRFVMGAAVLCGLCLAAVGQENDAITDVTAAMRKKHAIEKKLEVVKAVEDITAIAADGPKVTKLDVKPLVAGWYTFVFANVDDKGFAYQTRTLRLGVRDDVDGTAATISPDGEVWDVLRFGLSAAKTGTVVHVTWSFNVGMGGPSGWELVSVTYDEKKPGAGKAAATKPH